MKHIKKENAERGLSLKNIFVSVDNKKIVYDISLTIQPGELHFLMGPNGSGKSTLLYALMGHPKYEITQGKAMLGGKSLFGMPSEKRACSGLFLGFQQPREISGLKTISFLLSLKRIHASRHSKKKIVNSPTEFMKQIREYAQSISLPEHELGRSLNEGFSGGEKKKMEILQMMVSEPRIALLDEIDSGVDIDSLKSILSTVQTVQKKFGTGILLVTHNPHVLSLMRPDKVHVMMNGKISASGDLHLAERIEKEGYKFIKK